MVRIVHNPPSPNAIASYTEAACDACGKGCRESRQYGGLDAWASSMATLRAKSAGWLETTERRILTDRDGKPTCTANVRGLACPDCRRARGV